MFRTSFNNDWQARPKPNPFAELSGAAVPFHAVTIPHDAVAELPRDSAAEGSVGFYPSGVFEYRKTFAVPERQRGQRVIVEFDGVYRDAMVYVNGAYAGQRPNGYAPFHIDATPYLNADGDNEIRVETRNHQDSRWYSGGGIYRDTWLLVGGPVRIAPHGLRVATPDIDGERAVVEVTVAVDSDVETLRTVRLVTEIRDRDSTVVAADTAPITVAPHETATARRRLYVRTPVLWGPDSPELYECVVSLIDGDAEIDRDSTVFGIRSLRLDPVHGLRINGTTVELRGACIHHDNGPLGAATYPRAEQRRVELLKAAGFNAIRMSHHPMSTAMLDACDRLGMLVVDETFDMWTSAKNPFDYSLSFPQWWERDLEALVDRDFNHPSVVLYSIGNEIPEVGTPAGAAWSRRLAEKLRALDGTRYVTNAVNNMLAVIDELKKRAGQTLSESAGINTMMADPGDLMNAIAASELVSERTAEAYAVLDVAGMNYSESRYALDAELFPGRIVLGTETFPTHIDGNWELVRRHPHVIGDFTWTGWDYLGEVGIGRPQYAGETPSFTAPYPHLVAGCGDIDITGHRRPVSYYREIVFGRRADPYLAVQRPQHHGETFTGTPWAWSDSIASWTWPGFEDAPITVEIYCDADDVELRLDGRSLGFRPAGPAHRYRAAFDTVYRPGELVAIAYRDGVAVGTCMLRTATGDRVLCAEPDRPVVTDAPGDLAYITLALTDRDGTVDTANEVPLTVDITGAGTLLALGSADPAAEERFDAATRHTYEGRALAIVRPCGAGEIRLRATAPGLDPVEVTVTVKGAG
ncbi:glycoside hydrolase family 2 TIM barrel-domain containing protein [Nocardia sp. BMG111209]|uniref:glycoside hydrolase family 2 TIM barrel-domain containing protein n=1 Tax=Nocardia sp. BMG111209 TaxID=1160137 RepID=UPI0003742F1F|nr:glycoside hydrolase family 2 TIM barrel-domain containing protein [Nocardia sp. BMG111209]